MINFQKKKIIRVSLLSVLKISTIKYQSNIFIFFFFNRFLILISYI